MPNLKLVVQYVGTAYHGWQIQPGVPTIQGALQAGLQVILRQPVTLVGAGRTDAGVHARAQVASFRFEGSVLPARLHRSINSILPADIAVLSIEEVEEEFHARHSARGRRYRYQVTTGECRSPFLRAYAAHSRRPLDVSAMDRAARAFTGNHDFSSFRGAGDQSASPVKEIRSATVRLDPSSPGLIRFDVEASGFLQYMVRNIAGTLMWVGWGRIDPSGISTIIAARDRTKAGPTAPAHGLCLMEVLYEESGLAAPGGGW